MALGMTYGATWYKYWYQHKERDILVKQAKALSSNRDLNKLLKDKF